MNNDSKHIKGDVLEEFSDRERLRNTPVLNLKSDVLEEFSDLEQLRNTPGLNLKTPTTFAEAASMAKERMKMRELSLVSGTQVSCRPQETQARKILDYNWESAVTDSTLSPTKSYNYSMVSVISPTVSSMSNVGSQIEGDVSKQLLSLTIGDGPNATSDSFSSAPEISFNKGASAFMELIEQTLAKQAATEEALKFESLIVDMMSVDIHGKVPTPDHIPSVLSENGWDLAQVASVWTVS